MSYKYFQAITPRVYPLRYVSPAICAELTIPVEVSIDTGYTITSYLPIWDLPKPGRPRWVVVTPRYLTFEWEEYPNSVGYQVAIQDGDQYYVMDDFILDTRYEIPDSAWEWWLAQGHLETDPPTVVYRAYTYHGLTEYSDPPETA